MSDAAPHHPKAPTDDAPLDLRERGALREGAPQEMDRRLFMQLLVFEVPTFMGAGGAASVQGATDELVHTLRRQEIPAVVYADVNHPRGIGLLTWSEDPAHFVDRVRPVAQHPALSPRPEYTMLGRTYSTGYEPDLTFWLLDRPRDTALHEGWDWAVWYPLRRQGAFNRLEPREQGSILREHGAIGKAYGAADLAHDIRLACHGLDGNDNDFVVGLIGKALHPLSHVVQAMRRTRQTAEYMDQMGPFFVGRAVARVRG